MTDLGSLGGSYSVATGINNSGQVAGFSTTPTGAYHAFITGQNGVGMTDLGSLGGGESIAWSINDAGQVVGLSTTATGDQHAFITGSNGAGMTDLNSLVSPPGGFVLNEAVGINNLGQILAMSAAPEPETYAMLLAGLALLGFMMRGNRNL
jgi:probable HAF family extracellular repeat protein